MPLALLDNQRTRSRRAAMLALAVVAVVAAAPAAPAGAGPRTDSEAIVDQAGRAVEALQEWQATRSPVDYVRFVQGRDRTAELTGDDLEVDADQLRDEWAASPLAKQQALLSAMTQLGVPYKYAASEPGVAFDCSGLTLWAFGQAGATLPRVSGDQIDAVGASDAGEPGDLVYWPGHIGIYLGAGTYVHSPNSGNVVEATRLPDRSVSFGDAVAAGAADGSDEPVQPAAGPDEVIGSLVRGVGSLMDRTAPVTE